MLMKVNWKKLIEVIVTAIIAALSAIGTSETAHALNLFGN